MKEQVISFQVSKLAKEKGFDWDVLHSYRDGIIDLEDYFTGQISEMYFNGNGRNRTKFKEICSAPTQSLLQRWLRDNHDIYISINTTTEERWYSDDIGDVEHVPVHKFRIIKNIDNFKYDVIEWSNSFEEYEEALEEGLMESLKLIEQ